MPANQITISGIQIQTYIEITNQIINGDTQVAGLKSIYGSDINVDSNTPDGQMVNIFALSKQDVLDLCVAIYDSFDPDQAIGVALDSLSQLCGITRQGGSYTKTEVVVTTNRTLNLVGLDNPTGTPFTIADSNGNLFYLLNSASLSSGVNTLNFQSASIGFFQLLPNTLTVIVTTTAGVVSVNNPSEPYAIGQNQETDAQLRLRRQQSVAVPSQGFLQGLFGGLNTIIGLEQCVIYENNSSVTNAYSVPAHSIWVIVNGGDSDEVANMIYAYRNAGCGMYGSITVNVSQIDSTTFPIAFSRAVDQPLSITMNISSLSGGTIDTSVLKTALSQQYILGIYEEADVTSIAVVVRNINPDIVINSSGVSVSDGGSYTPTILPTNRYNIFVSTAPHIFVTVT